MENLQLNPDVLESQYKPNPFLQLRSHFLENGKPVSYRRLETLMGGSVKFSHISELEKGKAPSLAELKAYHEFFKVSYEYLLGETDNPSLSTEKGKSELRSDIDNSITYLSTSNDLDNKLIWQLINMLLTTNKGLAILYYLSEFFFGKSGKGGYEMKDHKLYFTKNKYNDDLEAGLLKRRLLFLKEKDENLGYNELRISAD